MSEIIEEIQRYIERTKIANFHQYSMSSVALAELSEQICGTTDFPFKTVILVFKYGRAKGYRAAKAEAKRKNKEDIINE